MLPNKSAKTAEKAMISARVVIVLARIVREKARAKIDRSTGPSRVKPVDLTI